MTRISQFAKYCGIVARAHGRSLIDWIVMPEEKAVPKDSRRAWLSGLAIIITTLTALFGFWRISPGATFVIACLALVALLAALWMAGKDD